MPPQARPMPPLLSMICVRLVHVGARRRNSITFNDYFVRRRPNQLNWKRRVNEFQEGIRGSILAGARGR